MRLSSQKVIGASLIVFCEPRQPDLDFLKDTEIKINKGILVDSCMRTNIPFIFAIGDVSELQDREKVGGWEAAQKEGKELGALLCQI